MAIKHDPEEARQELNEQFSLRQEQHHWKIEETRQAFEQEQKLRDMDNTKDIKIKELELQITKANGLLREKQISRRTYWTSIIKLPVIPFAVFFVFILELRRHDIPDALEDFIRL